jgi:PmbA protein
LPDKDRGVQDLELAQQIVREATKLGADFADAFVGRGRHIAVEAENGSIRNTEVGETDSVGVRAFIKGARGTVSISGFAARNLNPRDVAREAVDIARSADADPDFKSLPPFEPTDELEGLYDEKFERFSPADAVAAVGRAIDGAKAVDADSMVMADFSVSAGSGAVANSLGVAIERKSSSVDHGVFVVIKRGEDVGAFYDFDAGRVLADVDLPPVGRAAAEGALTFLGARKIETKAMPIILGPLSAYSFLKTIAGAANAENIQRKRSYLVDKLGEKIGCELLTIVDNGLIPHGLSSGTHDGEGARRREVTIFEEGRFAAMLHNSYTANKAGAANTGHGSRSGGVSPTNVFIKLGTSPAADIVASVKEGLYINIGSLAVNSASGDISTSVDFGYKIENGRFAYPVANAMVAGHIFDVLGAIEAVSSDYRSEPGAIMPTILIRSMDVSGGDLH